MSKASATNASEGKRKRIALIDADSILYATACGAEMRMPAQEEGEADTWFQVKSLEEAFAEVVSKCEALVGDTESDDAILCLTTTKCFRYHVWADYKHNRMGTHRPGLLLELQAKVQEERPFGVVAVRGLEADDVCAISSGHLQLAPYREPVVVSIDKDLKGVPGMVYSPLRPKEGIIEVTEAMADRQFLYQTLVGDPVDGYPGCRSVGPKKAAKLLDDIGFQSVDLQWGFVLEQFKKRGLSEKDALTQARVARIVRSKEWNQDTRQVHLWSPGSVRPEIIDLDDLPYLRSDT